MKTYFFDARTGQTISSSSPSEMEYLECRRILNKLRTEGSFLGIILDECHVLQILCEKDGLFWLEILDQKDRATDGCTVNLPMAETALEAAAKGKAIKHSLGDYFLRWTMKPLD